MTVAEILVAKGSRVITIKPSDTIAALCDHVVVLAEGRNLAEGTFAQLVADAAVQEAYMGRRQ